MVEDGRMAQFSKKEAARLERELKHLQQNFSGVENMATPPDVMFVIDPERGIDRGARSAPHGHSSGGDRRYELRS